MERLLINVPKKKSALVKQLLQELGIVFQSIDKDKKKAEMKSNLEKVSVWSDEDLEVFEKSKKEFNKFSAPKW